MAHSSKKNDTFIRKWHIHPKMPHSSENGTFIQKCHIHQKMAHSSKNGTFMQKLHIYPNPANLFFIILGMSWIGTNASRDLTLTNQVA